MSGIYIKGLEMPQNCRECPFLYVTSVCDGFKDCPLIPVPDHGRLIDADALMEHKSWVADAWSTDMSYRTEAVNVCDIINAPTIIPAEEVE